MIEITGGGIIGRDHVRTARNCQDAFYWYEDAGVLVAVVCDGCGSNEHSEVGAKVGSKLAVQSTLRHYLSEPEAFATAGPKSQGLDRVKRSVLSKIQTLADDMAGGFSENIRQYFLFTILGAIFDLKAQKAYIFGCGDGVFYVNGDVTILQSKNNAPDYLSYNLVEPNPLKPDLEMLWRGPLETVKSMLIGTDGVSDLAKSFEDRIPGRDEKIGSISQFWEKDSFFKNPFSIGHRLSLINRSVRSVDWEKKDLTEAHGPLRDDTTLIAIRRKK